MLHIEISRYAPRSDRNPKGDTAVQRAGDRKHKKKKKEEKLRTNNNEYL